MAIDAIFWINIFLLGWLGFTASKNDAFRRLTSRQDKWRTTFSLLPSWLTFHLSGGSMVRLALVLLSEIVRLFIFWSNWNLSFLQSARDSQLYLPLFSRICCSFVPLVLLQFIEWSVSSFFVIYSTSLKIRPIALQGRSTPHYWKPS